MKPRTKIEKEAERYAPELPELTEAQRRWAEGMLPKHGLIEKGEVVCLECGATFANDANAVGAELLEEKVICPHCGKKIQLKQRHGRKNGRIEKTSFNLLAVCHGYQVVRTFYVEKWTRPGIAQKTTIYEVSQSWYDEQGYRAVRARSRTYIYYIDNFNMSSQMSVKDYSNSFGYHFNSDTYPQSNIMPKFRKRGMNAEALRYISPFTAIELLSKDECKIETLLKTKRWEFFGLDYGAISLHWPQIRLCLRHGYRPNDVNLWYDCLRFLNRLGMDDHNPKYVCPGDIKALHDELMRRARKKEDVEAKRRERERLRKLEHADEYYVEEKGKFFGLCFVGGDIKIEPLKSIAEFVDEGKAMHNCVGTEAQHYWDRKCLIMSARCGEERLATIEISLEDFRIKQCYGPCNMKPERDSDIRKLILRNIAEIKLLHSKKHPQDAQKRV